MKKGLHFLLFSFIFLILVACGNKVDDEIASKYVGKAEEVVLLLNAGNYEEVHSLFNSKMKEGLSVEQMGELTPIIEESGEFENIDKSSVEEKDGHYIVVLVANYSDKNRVYTITFDGNDEIAGLYIK